jgi:hypothetical protein
MTLRIELTDLAIGMIKWDKITRGEFTQLLDLLKEVAALPNPAAHYAVTAVHCTDDNWLRMKHRPTNIRVIFEYDESVLTVHMMARRTDNVYKWVEIWYGAANVVAA